MKTAIEVDEKTINEVIKTTGAKTKKRAIEIAIDEFLKMQRRQALKELPGKIELDLNLKTLEKMRSEGRELHRGVISGHIKKLKHDRGYGFIVGVEGKEYFFNLTDLEGIEWETITEGQEVIFDVKKEPEGDKAGAAAKVRSYCF